MNSSATASPPPDHLPASNDGYARLDYWQERYKNEESFDWFVCYSKIRDLVSRHVDVDDAVLNLGCGNSSMPMEMWRDGFRNVTNVDYSSVVVEAMAARTLDLPGLAWVVADVLELERAFAPESFDVVLEKGTLDALLVSERDPWNFSDEAEVMLDRVLERVSCLLKPGGRFMSITFCQPHFRLPFYADRKFGWGARVETIGGGSGFHYFCYVLTKGEPLSPSDEQHRLKYLQRKTTRSEEEEEKKKRALGLNRVEDVDDDDDDNEDEDYLLRIGHL